MPKDISQFFEPHNVLTEYLDAALKRNEEESAAVANNINLLIEKTTLLRGVLDRYHGEHAQLSAARKAERNRLHALSHEPEWDDEAPGVPEIDLTDEVETCE